MVAVSPAVLARIVSVPMPVVLLAVLLPLAEPLTPDVARL